MKKCYCTKDTLLLFMLLLISTMCEGLRSTPHDITGSNDEGDETSSLFKEERDDDILKGMFATGSSLPDCTNACGACFPCKRVMVSFKCSVAESCPIVYRCMCKGKYYHVPSN
ncbi:protein EPIDERMAL PATTERNING FACTOR 2-like [Ananas comosus]|uniref:Epidermal patterning factor-like protein n=1 Tax=Ananas comosus TaxID=4615 RepID=A0A6P5GR34_ANACO|nr:protein EPIDERMAL PATTERNING FACTOR 2-like [Ananas comosus]XP_020110272.1 protein EPIDERMAL PATTERNING FACTOR 2-like [Ananas comosus]